MNAETPLQSDMQMDEFETSNKILSKQTAKNSLKMAKVLAIGLATVFVLAVALYAMQLMAKNRQITTVSTPTPSAIVNSSPTPAVEIQYPEEYKILNQKISGYEQDVLNPREERSRLNPPSLSIGPTY